MPILQKLIWYFRAGVSNCRPAGHLRPSLTLPPARNWHQKYNAIRPAKILLFLKLLLLLSLLFVVVLDQFKLPIQYVLKTKTQLNKTNVLW